MSSVNEYPLQKDEVEVTSSKTERKVTGASTKIVRNTNNTSNDYVGFVIGVLTVVILILMAAIVFIVYRNHKLKERCEASAAELHDDFRFEGIKVSQHDSSFCSKLFLIEQHPIFVKKMKKS